MSSSDHEQIFTFLFHYSHSTVVTVFDAASASTPISSLRQSITGHTANTLLTIAAKFDSPSPSILARCRTARMAEMPPLSSLDRAARSALLPQTPVTLLQRIRQSRDPAAWDDLVRLLAPLVDHWMRRSLIDHNDRADVAQDVFLELSRRLPVWDYDSSRSFRAWLRIVTRSKCIDLFRKRGERAAEYELSQAVAAESPDELEIQERAVLARAALRLLRSQVRDDVWTIFRRHVLEEEPAGTVAVSNGVEVNYVYLIRSRLLAKLRALLANLRD